MRDPKQINGYMNLQALVFTQARLLKFIKEQGFDIAPKDFSNTMHVHVLTFHIELTFICVLSTYLLIVKRKEKVRKLLE